MMVSATLSPTSDGSQEQGPGQLFIGHPRKFDDKYQQDELTYQRLMRGILRLLSVRSAPDLRTRILTIPLRILNRGRVEAFVSRGPVFIDIALLDLLWYFSFEQGVAEIKRDPYHMIEFTLEYADALHNNRPFEQPDPYNSAALSDVQFRQLFDDILHVQHIAFENTLAFVLAHEIGHLFLDHEGESKQMFPNPATHRPDNASWLLWRRRAELAADRFGALLSLDALYQPAQVIPWLNLVEARRSYYGNSVEYPTPGQRESTIWSAYAKRFGGDGIETSGLPKVDPLPPDRDVSKVGRAHNLQNFRRIRTFRRDFLAELDTQVQVILSESHDVELTAAYFLHQIEANRRLLCGADHPEAIEEALARLDAASGGHAALVKELSGLFERAFSVPEPVNLLTMRVEQEPLDVEGLRQELEWASKGDPMLADALELGYFLANTRFRWEPGVFESMLAQLPEPQRTRLHLAPYRIGEPARKPSFTLDQRVEGLQRWDGSYAEAAEASSLKTVRATVMS